MQVTEYVNHCGSESAGTRVVWTDFGIIRSKKRRRIRRTSRNDFLTFRLTSNNKKEIQKQVNDDRK